MDGRDRLSRSVVGQERPAWDRRTRPSSASNLSRSTGTVDSEVTGGLLAQAGKRERMSEGSIGEVEAVSSYSGAMNGRGTRGLRVEGSKGTHSAKSSLEILSKKAGSGDSFVALSSKKGMAAVAMQIENRAIAAEESCQRLRTQLASESALVLSLREQLARSEDQVKCLERELANSATKIVSSESARAFAEQSKSGLERRLTGLIADAEKSRERVLRSDRAAVEAHKDRLSCEAETREVLQVCRDDTTRHTMVSGGLLTVGCISNCERLKRS